MSQPLPTVRQIYAPALIPQVLAIAVLSIAFHLWLPSKSWPYAVFLGALTYLIYCRIARAIVLRHHSAGIVAYKARRFDEALRHSRASFEYFERHVLIDRYRSLVLGAASSNSFRTIALINSAYGEAMRGNRAQAVSLFRQVLSETPDCANAEFGLKMLQGSGDGSSGAP
jgi:hypothetical protein